jgi:hypothetical protein
MKLINLKTTVDCVDMFLKYVYRLNISDKTCLYGEFV